MAPDTPLNVLEVASSLHAWGGIERYVAYLSRGLADRGHTVTVACPPGSPLARRIEVPFVPVTIRGKFSPLNALPYLRLFRQRRFDVVHVHFSPDFAMPVWAARFCRVPRIVMTRHVSLPWPPHKVRSIVRRFDRIIAVSDAVQARLIASGIPSGMLVVAKAGVPALTPSLEPAAARTALGIEPGLKAFGYFGRLDREKGVDVLAAASPSLPAGCEVHVFGKGERESDLRKLAGPAFRMHGYVENVADAMSAMDAIVVPSVWEEAFPYSVLEAFSLGKPVLASQIGGLPELVSEGRTGWMVPAGDPTALAEAMARLHRGACAEAGAAALEVQRSEYTIERMAERIEAALR